MQLLVVIAVFLVFSTGFITADVDPLADVSSALDNFAYNVGHTLNNLKEDETDSTLGLAMALGIILRGAKGQTAAEIKQVLCAQNITDDAIHQKLLKLLSDEENESREEFTLRVGNMALVSKDIPLRNDYVKFIENNYHGLVEVVDFKNGGQSIVNNVNDFVANKTFGVINNALESPFSSDTKLALVNSVYVKGSWVTPFPKANTHFATFTNIDQTLSQVDTMHAVLKLKVCHLDSIRATVFVLPMKGKSVMLIFLPDDLNGFYDAVANVEPSMIHQCITAAKEEKTNLFLPKFRVEGQTGVKQVLRKLGAVSMFDPAKADLTGISDIKPLWVNELVHKVALNINEDGVDADQAKTGAIQKSSPGEDEDARTVRVNQPFCFGIYDLAHKIVIQADHVHIL